MNYTISVNLDSRVSPTPITATPRQHAQVARADRYDVVVVRQCRANARTYGWDTLEPPINPERWGRRYFGYG